MSTLKSGVYFVKFKDIDKFFQDVEKNGWKHNFDKPQKNIHETLIALDKEDETIKQSVIPFALNQEKNRVGYWVNGVCLESEVEENMRTWSKWCWSDRHIEFYQAKKLIL